MAALRRDELLHSENEMRGCCVWVVSTHMVVCSSSVVHMHIVHVLTYYYCIDTNDVLIIPTSHVFVSLL